MMFGHMDELEYKAPGEPGEPQPSAQKQPGKLKQQLAKLRAWVKTHPRKAAAIGIILAVILAGAGWLAYAHFSKKPVVQEAQQEAPKEIPKTIPSPLTGVELSRKVAERPIRTVVIENSPEARPQSGLSQAGVVYESVSEGGITRYMAIFLENRPKIIGPVRSLRSFAVSWTREFNSPIAHVGGNASAMDLLRPAGVQSLNQFFNGAYYYRTNDRFAPHNVYTTSGLLDKLLKVKGAFHRATMTPSPRKDDEPPADGVTIPHKTINVRFSYSGYDVRWAYDVASNGYKRFLAGAADKDRNTGKQITVKNVVVEYMPTTYGISRNGEKQTNMKTVGSGKAVVFRDGKATVGTWKKDSHSSRTKLLDAEGKEIALNRGNTWYCVIPLGTGSLRY